MIFLTYATCSPQILSKGYSKLLEMPDGERDFILHLMDLSGFAWFLDLHSQLYLIRLWPCYRFHPCAIFIAPYKIYQNTYLKSLAMHRTWSDYVYLSTGDHLSHPQLRNGLPTSTNWQRWRNWCIFLKTEFHNATKHGLVGFTRGLPPNIPQSST